MKKPSIIDIAILTASVVIILIALAFLIKINSNKIYIQKYVNSETGVCYLVTDNAIIEMKNPDGSLHCENN